MYTPWDVLADIGAMLHKGKDVFLLDSVLSSANSPFVLRHSPATLDLWGIVSSLKKEYHRQDTLEIHCLPDTCMSFKATDPRDKIFAILGISPEGSSYAIKVDCSRSVSDVYIDAGHHLIGRNEFFEVLQWAGVGYSHRTKVLQSRVPDWNIGRPNGPLGQAFATREANYRSAIDTNAGISIAQNSQRIVVVICLAAEERTPDQLSGGTPLQPAWKRGFWRTPEFAGMAVDQPAISNFFIST